MSERGAFSTLLPAALERIVSSRGGDREDYLRALAPTVIASGDMAHATHPNYAERHEPQHQIAVNAGPVLKTNNRLRYATDARGLPRSPWRASRPTYPSRSSSSDRTCRAARPSARSRPRSPGRRLSTSGRPCSRCTRRASSAVRSTPRCTPLRWPPSSPPPDDGPGNLKGSSLFFKAIWRKSERLSLHPQTEGGQLGGLAA